MQVLAHRYVNRGVDAEDLEQVAALALMKAIHRYDVSAATPFGAYATPTITGELRRYFRDHGWMVRPPRDLQENRQRLSQRHQALTRELKREPSRRELADDLQVSLAYLGRVEIANSNLRHVSLSTPAHAGSEATILDSVRPLIARDERDLDLELSLRISVQDLTPLQQQFIHLRYTQGKTQQEIAPLLGLGQMELSP